MIVEEVQNIVERMFTKYHYSIRIICDNPAGFVKELEAIDDLTLFEKPYCYKNSNEVIVYPRPLNVKLRYYYLRIPGKSKNEWKYNDIVFEDFKGSKSFYAVFTKKKGAKILSDEYSNRRAKLLYEKVGALEQTLRTWYYDLYGLEKIDKGDKRTKDADHPIAQLELGKFFYSYLSEPPSDDFFLAKYGDARSEREVLQLKALTRFDEMFHDISKGEFSKFINIRNAIMHFKVLTISDALFTIDFISRFNTENLVAQFLKKT